MKLYRKCFALAAVGAISLGTATLPAFAASPRVIDGDTIELDHQRYRLFGIDAPEWKQQCRRGVALWNCGTEAKRALERMISGKDVRCEPRDRDKYRRIVAVCYVGRQDINRAMVRQGWAVAYTRYSRDYVSDERAAKAEKLGIWSGEFETPERYRRESSH